jgi:hypothetical protein
MEKLMDDNMKISLRRQFNDMSKDDLLIELMIEIKSLNLEVMSLKSQLDIMMRYSKK